MLDFDKIMAPEDKPIPEDDQQRDSKDPQYSKNKKYKSAILRKNPRNY